MALIGYFFAQMSSLKMKKRSLLVVLTLLSGTLFAFPAPSYANVKDKFSSVCTKIGGVTLVFYHDNEVRPAWKEFVHHINDNF